MYSVKTDGKVFWVTATGPHGQEYAVTQTTKSKPQADEWCRALSRAAQINADRRVQAKGRKR